MTRREDLIVTVLRLRAAGRSWSEVRSATGLAVAEAKAFAAEDAQARRDHLARTLANETARGLLDVCYGVDHDRLASCRHPRAQHGESGCGECGCLSFTAAKPGPLVYDGRHPADVNQQLRRLTGVLVTHDPYSGEPLRIAYHAWNGGGWRRWNRNPADDPRIPRAKKSTRLRRARRKGASG